jgi:glucose uptake protein
MVLAQTPTQVLLIMIFGMLCWGLWAGFYKLAGKWRYELFYFDVAFGLTLAVVLYSMTLGSLGFDGFSFMDDVMHASKRQWLVAFGAGIIFNLGNMLMMGAAAIAGLSVALTLGLGVSLMIGVEARLLLSNTTANPLLLFLGATCLLIAVVTIGVAYIFLISARQDELVRQGKVATTTGVAGHAKGLIVSTNAPSATKGLLLAIISGALIWLMLPLIDTARAGETGLGPYSTMAFFALGLLVSTIIFNNFFLNLPVQGEAIELLDYFRGSLRAHLAGLAAGAVLCTGLLALLVAHSGPPTTLLSPPTFYALEQSAVLIGAVWGIFRWKDFRNAPPRVWAMVWTFILLFGMGLVSMALSAQFPRAA